MLTPESIARIGWSATFSLELKFAIPIADEQYGVEFDFIDLPIPGAGFKLPGALAKVLNWILPGDYEVKPEAGASIVRRERAFVRSFLI